MNLSNYTEPKPHFKKRIVWHVVNVTLFKLFPGHLCKWWRNMLLRMFGANIDKDALIYSSCKIYAPWNLTVGRACIGPHTRLYNKDNITIGNDSVISQGTYLCTASHDTSSLMLPLITGPIYIGNYVWIAADVFVGMGVQVGEGAIVGAKGAIFKNVPAWTIVGGNPAKIIKERQMDKDNEWKHLMSR